MDDHDQAESGVSASRAIGSELSARSYPKEQVEGLGPFICHTDLEDIMHDFERVDRILQELRMTPEQRDTIRKQGAGGIYLSCLAVLIMIDNVSKFPRLFALLECSVGLDLPLPRPFLREVWPDSQFCDVFHQTQHFVCPRQIRLFTAFRSNHQVERFDANERLPIQNKTSIGQGSFASVHMVTIAPRYLVTDNDNVNESPRRLALKEFDNTQPFRRDSFDRETSILRDISSHASQHSHIVYMRGAFQHGQKSYIILDVMDYGNLQSVLYGSSRDRECPLEAANPMNKPLSERGMNPQEFASDCMKQMARLASALKHLHNGDPGIGRGETWAHRDVKPSNILIGKHPDDSISYRSGQWCISDFGISELYLERTTGDARHGDSSSPVHFHGQVSGSYRAPEEFDPQPESSRRTDVWAFMCIFLEVLTYLSGGTTAVNEFAQNRIRCSPDQLPSPRFTSARINGQGRSESEKPQLFVNRAVEEKMHELASAAISTDHWIICSIALVRRCLVGQRKHRPESEEIEVALGKVVHHIEARATRCNCHDGHSIPAFNFLELDVSDALAQQGTAHKTRGSRSPSRQPPDSISTQPSPPRSLQPLKALLKPDFYKTSTDFQKCVDICISAQTNTVIRLSRSGRLDFRRLQWGKPRLHIEDLRKVQVEGQPMGVKRRVCCSPKPDTKWKGIACAGEYLAVWQYKSRLDVSKAFLFSGLGSGELQSLGPMDSCKFRSIRVGQLGHFVFHNDSDFNVWSPHVRHDDPQISNPPQNKRPIDQHESFEDVRFNDRGDKLYAWSCGRDSDDAFYVWSLANDLSSFETRSIYRFDPYHDQRPEMQILPFSNRTGCLVHCGQNRNVCFRAIPTVEKDAVYSRDHIRYPGRDFKVCILDDKYMFRLLTGRTRRIDFYDVDQTELSVQEGTPLAALERSAPSSCAYELVTINDDHFNGHCFIVIAHKTLDLEIVDLEMVLCG